MKIWFAILILVGIFTIASCLGDGSEIAEQDIQKNLNPNGDSELALLMRSMQADLEELKRAIKSGEKMELTFDVNQILTAKATVAEDVDTPHYRALGRAFIAAYKAYENAPYSERKTSYEVMVSACMACHEQTCPGPMRRIKNLYL